MIRINAPHFVAGAILCDGVVTDAAPIVGYMAAKKWSYQRVTGYCEQKGWRVEVVS